MRLMDPLHSLALQLADEGQPGDAIAAQLAIDPTAVGPVLQIARAKLRALEAMDDPDPEADATQADPEAPSDEPKSHPYGYAASSNPVRGGRHGIRSPAVIARVWRGWTTPDNADAYEAVVSTEVLPAIAARRLDGYHGAYLLRRDVDGEVEFSTIMLFDSIDNVRAFTGDDYAVAHVPPDARAVLSRFDEHSAHYDLLLSPDDTR
jgi:hypothetical protein